MTPTEKARSEYERHIRIMRGEEVEPKPAEDTRPMSLREYEDHHENIRGPGINVVQKRALGSMSRIESGGIMREVEDVHLPDDEGFVDF